MGEVYAAFIDLKFVSYAPLKYCMYWMNTPMRKLNYDEIEFAELI